MFKTWLDACLLVETNRIQLFALIVHLLEDVFWGVAPCSVVEI
jgi:hypothetical protein